MTQPWSRVMLVGGGGAGKTVMAQALAARLDLPVVHLDREYWLPGWVEPDRDRWNARVAALANAPRWVMDGNYGSSLASRLERADVVVLLDLPRRVVIPRVLRRAWRYRRSTRPDMAPGCPEKIDLAFLRWIWNFRRRSLPRIIAALAATPHPPPVIRLNSPRQIRMWLDHL